MRVKRADVDMTDRWVARWFDFLKRSSGIIAFVVTTLLILGSVAWGTGGHAASARGTRLSPRELALATSPVTPNPTATPTQEMIADCQFANSAVTQGKTTPFITWLSTQCASWTPGDPSVITTAINQAGQSAEGWLGCYYSQQKVANGDATWLDKLTVTTCHMKAPPIVVGIHKTYGQPPAIYNIDAQTAYYGSSNGTTDNVVVWAGTVPGTGGLGGLIPPDGAVVEGIGPASGARATVPRSGVLTLTSVLSSTSLELTAANGTKYTFDITTGTLTAQ